MKLDQGGERGHTEQQEQVLQSAPLQPQVEQVQSPFMMSVDMLYEELYVDFLLLGCSMFDARDC